jgi:hypothetical protein
MFSGKAAASDFIREHAGFHVPNNRSEFDLVRMPHGLLDLKRSFVDEWSPVRSDKAIREFSFLIEVLGRVPRNTLEKLFKPGFGYSRIYDRFLEKSRNFVAAITSDTWLMQWPYELSSLSPLQHARLKILSKLRRVHAWPIINYHLISGENFIFEAKKYLLDLLTSGIDGHKYHTVITHNMLEPYDPAAGFCLFDDIKTIIVDRDVRDIYITATNYSFGFNDIVPLYSRIIGAFNVELFIRRQRLLRSKTNYKGDDRVLRLAFEDLVIDYDATANKIRSFLNVEESDHLAKFQHFNPDESASNIGLWRRASKEQLKAIHRIEQELPELCRQ